MTETKLKPYHLVCKDSAFSKDDWDNFLMRKLMPADYEHLVLCSKCNEVFRAAWKLEYEQLPVYLMCDNTYWGLA